MIDHVSDTALWVAYYRAQESDRPDALFRDPYAKKLAGEKGRAIAQSMGSTSKYTRWTLAIRTVLIDRFIEETVSTGVDTILNLGAGLDTRPYRMSLPADLRWIEVDHPAILEHKESVLKTAKPRCRLERVKLDLALRAERQALFADINARARHVLVLTEGVLPYLSESHVAELAEDLRNCVHFDYWVAEYFAKETYRYINTPQRARQMKNAPFRFFPDDWFAFFGAHGWGPREVKYLGEETLRLGRKIPAPWWTGIFRILPFPNGAARFKRFQRMMGFVLFERSAG